MKFREGSRQGVPQNAKHSKREVSQDFVCPSYGKNASTYHGLFFVNHHVNILDFLKQSENS